MTRVDVAIPIASPNILADVTTKNASYMNNRCPWAFVNPIDLKTPYSQIFSRTFYRVDTNNRKKTRVSEMSAIRDMKRLKTSIEEFRLSTS